MRALRAVALLLAACGAASARRGLQAAAAVNPVAPQPVRVGMLSVESPPLSQWVDGKPAGYEALLLDALAREANLAPQVVKLDSLEDRITALQNGTVDMVLDAFTITPDREELVDFVYPAYYSSGTVPFAMGSNMPDIKSWADLAGHTVALLSGNYILESPLGHIPEIVGVQLLPVDDLEGGAAAVASGQAIAYLDDSSILHPGYNLTLVPGLAPIEPAPMALAVARGNTQLADKLSRAMLALAAGGKDSPLLQIEAETFLAQGGEPDADLAALVANPEPGGSSLYPAASGGPASAPAGNAPAAAAPPAVAGT